MRATRSPPFHVDRFIAEVSRATATRLEPSTTKFVSFTSRKHATVEVHSTVPGWERVVAKHFQAGSETLMETERAVLEVLGEAGIPVPGILHVLDGFLVLTFVPGQVACDVVNARDGAGQGSGGTATSIASAMGTWLGAAHECLARTPATRRRGDANLRNFIVMPGGTIAGLDFEEASEGDPAIDVVDAIDSLLVTSPGIHDTPLDALDWKFTASAALVASWEDTWSRPHDRDGLCTLAREVMRANAARRGWTAAHDRVEARVLARLARALSGAGGGA